MGGASDLGLFKAGVQAGDGLLPGIGVGDDLAHQRIVMGRDCTPRCQVSFHSNSVSFELKGIHRSRAGAEIVFGVFGVDAGLDGVTL